MLFVHNPYGQHYEDQIVITLNKDSMIEILHKNFGFKKVKDPFGNTAIQMSARNAFRYSLIEGTPYLAQEYGYTCKEQMRVFYGRSSLNDGFVYYTPGLFGVKRIDEKIYLDEGNSPYYLNKIFPSMFHGDKTIIFHEETTMESKAEVERDFHKKIKEKKKDPSEYLLSTVSKSNSRKESFLEFVASQYFNKEGYLTENQVPYANNQGVPDFAAYKTPLIDELIDKKFIESACPLSEISTACIFSNRGQSSKEKINYEVVIGEAKTNAKAIKQLCTHKELGLTSHLFEIFAKQKKQTDFGLLKFDDHYMIDYDPGPKQTIDKKLLKKDKIFFEHYIKFFLLGNLSIDKIKEKFVKSKTERESEQMIQKVMKTSFSDIVDFVEQEIF